MGHGAQPVGQALLLGRRKLLIAGMVKPERAGDGLMRGLHPDHARRQPVGAPLSRQHIDKRHASVMQRLGLCPAHDHGARQRGRHRPAIGLAMKALRFPGRLCKGSAGGDGQRQKDPPHGFGPLP
jgi:hypothetical protein